MKALSMLSVPLLLPVRPYSSAKQSEDTETQPAALPQTIYLTIVGLGLLDLVMAVSALHLEVEEKGDHLLEAIHPDLDSA